MILSRVPELNELIEQHISLALMRTRVAQPGRIEAFHPSDQTITVTPLIRSPILKDDGTTQWTDIPPISNVPLLTLFVAGGMRVKFPVFIGDLVLLVFCDFSIDDWKAGAGLADPAGIGRVTPHQEKGHALSDCIAIPGLFLPAKGSSQFQNVIEIAEDGTIILNGGNKNVARNTDPVAAGTTMAAWVAAVTTQLNMSGSVLGANGALAAPTDFGAISAGNPKIKG